MQSIVSRTVAAVSLIEAIFAAPALAQAQNSLMTFDPQQWAAIVSHKALTEGRQLVDANGNCLQAGTKAPAEGLQEGDSLISRPCQPMAPEQRFAVEEDIIKATLVAKEPEIRLGQAPWFSLCMTSISVTVSGIPSSSSAALARCGGSQKPFQNFRFENGQIIGKWRGWCLQGGNPNARVQNIYAKPCDGSAAQKWTLR